MFFPPVDGEVGGMRSACALILTSSTPHENRF